MDRLDKEQQANAKQALRLFPPYRVAERKIGKATFSVYSWFTPDKEKDIVSTVARLVQYDSEKAD